MGMYVSDHVVTNDELSQTLDTSDEWIRTRTGIRERRITEEYETNSYVCYKACKQAMEQAEMGPDDIDILMIATFTPDMSTPATACIVGGELKLTKAWAFDLNAACSGFLY
jgi:3-oxoacyl-[acyl-carrier-protein] synthase-3